MEIPLGDTFYFKFTTRAFASGVPTVLSGTPVVDIYEENNLTQITGAETLTVDYDSVVGLNDVAVVCSTGNGFEVGKYYQAVITTGTVGGVSVVGECVGPCFRIVPVEDAGAGIRDVNVTHVSDTSQTANDNGADINTLLTRIVGTLAAGTHNPQTGDSYAIVNSGTFGNAQLVRSTTPANTLDVNATGEAGIDLDNTSGTLTSADITSVAGAVLADASSDAIIADAVWNAATATYGDAGSYGLLVETDLDATISSRLASADINLTGGAVDTVTTVSTATNVTTVDGIAAGAITSTAIATDAIDADALAANAVAEIADGVWNEDIADHVAAGTFGEMGYLAAYIGPSGAGVYINDGAANTATVAGEDGTPSKPVSTMAAARTIADALGVQRYYFTGVAAAMDISATTEDWHFVGLCAIDSNVLDFNSADVDRSLFENLTLQGVQGGAERITCINCILQDDPGAGFTDIHMHAIRCGLASSDPGIRLTNNDDHIFDSCYSMVAGNAAPMIDAQSGANVDLSIRHYSGGIELQGLSATSTTSIETDGQVIFSATNTTTAPVTIRGLCTVTDNATMTNVTEGARIDTTQVGDAVWDRDATSNQTQGTFGQAIGDPVADATTIYQAVATDATGDNVAIDVAAIQTDLDNGTDGLGAIKTDTAAILDDTGTAGVLVSDGTGSGQIALTAGAVDTVTAVTNQVTADMTAISGDSAAADNLEASMESIITGTATGGDSDTVISGVTGHGDDTFNGRVLIFRTGTLQYEAGVITDYVSTTGTFEFAASTWTASPTTETFVIV